VTAQQTTFKTVFRPITKVINTILPGTALDFSGRATTLRFTANQLATFNSFIHAEHFFDGMPVIIHNEGSSDLLLAGAIMDNGAVYDIEPGTTGVFTYLASSGKLFDNGGSSYARDIQENLDVTNTNLATLNGKFTAHEHNGVDAPKVKVQNLDTQGVNSQYYVLALNASGIPAFTDMRTYIQATVRYSNTDITTNITPSTTWSEVPLMGTMERRDSNSIFIPVGNGVQMNWTGKVKVRTHVVASASIQNSQLDIAFKKNTVVRPKVASAFARVVSGADEATCFLYDEIDVLPGDTITVVARQGGANGPMVMFGAGSCSLEIEIPAGAFAKGDKGDAGYAGWQYYAQAGVPSSLLGNDGDVYLNTDNGDLYQRAAGTWSYRSNIKGPQGEQGISKSTVWAEKNGTLTNGAEEWSFGAASSSGSGRGLMQLVSGKVTHLALECRVAGTTSVSVELLVNGISTGQAVTLSAGVNKQIVALTTPVVFGATDIIGFRTVLGGGASNARVTALTVYDGVVIAPTGYVIPTPWKHKVTLIAQDITNGYIDLPHPALANTVRGSAKRLMIHENEDYTVSNTGGVSRITFINALAVGGEEALSAGDPLYFSYYY
jgi:hypothetical protein